VLRSKPLKVSLFWELSMLLKQRLGAQASRSVEEQAEIFIGL
jgi:hypothetical protein